MAGALFRRGHSQLGEEKKSWALPSLEGPQFLWNIPTLGEKTHQDKASLGVCNLCKYVKYASKCIFPFSRFARFSK